VHTQEVAKQVAVDRFLFYSDVIERNDMFDNQLYKKYVQCSGDLGMKMDYAFSIPFKDEYKRVVMIGSDCYEIGPHHIETAFTQLQQHDFVIGPATDGGYYLIGMKKWNRWIFQGKSWSASTLFEETKNEIIAKNGKLFELEPLTDVDTARDLEQIPELKQYV
jgi:rSAM/selenodomain-associated transferase 1